MNAESLLYRQVHPSFIQAGKVSSQAFRPTPKDSHLLSVYDGELISPELAWNHYTTALNLPSIGVMAVANTECRDLELPVRPDPLDGFPEHAVIDFSEFTRSEAEKKAKRLKAAAEALGWLYGSKT